MIYDHLLNDEGRQALAIALGESLRIGHFWLGIEFLLMGLSKQKGLAFPTLLEEMGMHPGQFRGMLRGIVEVTTEKDWRTQDVFALGAEALPDLQMADPEQLRRRFQANQEQSPVLTPRLLTILNDAVNLSDNGLVGHNQLLGATMRHRHALAMQVFFSVASQVGWPPERLIDRLSELIDVAPEELLGKTPKPAGKVPSPHDLFSPTQQHQQNQPIPAAYQTIRGRATPNDMEVEVIDEEERLGDLEKSLKRRVIGQDEAIAQLVQALRQTGSQTTDPKRPKGIFLFVGPPGVGKTTVALALTEAFYYQEEVFLQLDMSEFMQKQQMIRLIGSPPGYAGDETKGQLTEHLRQHPYSVVVMNDMEKAHKDVHTLFSQLFNTGRVIDSQEQLVDGSNSIFIMTTTLGAGEAAGVVKAAKRYQNVLKTAVDERFPSELLNHIDQCVYFAPLDEDALEAIFDIEFEAFQFRIREETGVEVTIDPKIKRQIATHLAKQPYGAGPLRRYIEDYIVAPVATQLVTGRYKPGTRIKITRQLQLPKEE